jgi:hypothetical protein
MKTSIKTFVCALALIATASFTASAEDKEAKKTAVLVDKANADSKTTILLKNAYGEVVYRETIAKNELKFGRTLNLDEMQAGKYSLDVISGKEKQSRSFLLSEQKTERFLTIK